jgi:GNAT superfamily N-acetyltransferase
VGDRDVGAIRLREARAEDEAALAGFAHMAGHGVMEMCYQGLVPGQPLLDTIVERRIRWPGGFCHWQRWTLAEDDAGRAVGGMNCFPHSVFDVSPPDPLLLGERLAAFDSLTDLEHQAHGSYYLNMIAVAPHARGQGIGALLVAEALAKARAAGFAMLSLATFEADAGLMNFYAAQGFKVTGTAPIAPHPSIEFGGNWALLGRRV